MCFLYCEREGIQIITLFSFSVSWIDGRAPHGLYPDSSSCLPSSLILPLQGLRAIFFKLFIIFYFFRELINEIVPLSLYKTTRLITIIIGLQYIYTYCLHSIFNWCVKFTWYRRSPLHHIMPIPTCTHLHVPQLLPIPTCHHSPTYFGAWASCISKTLQSLLKPPKVLSLHYLTSHHYVIEFLKIRRIRKMSSSIFSSV